MSVLGDSIIAGSLMPKKRTHGQPARHRCRERPSSRLAGRAPHAAPVVIAHRCSFINAAPSTCLGTSTTPNSRKTMLTVASLGEHLHRAQRCRRCSLGWADNVWADMLALDVAPRAWRRAA